MSLMLRPQLAHTRDRMGNGLLHLAAKTRNEELFSYLMKKIGPGSLVLRNNVILKLYRWAELHFNWQKCTVHKE